MQSHDEVAQAARHVVVTLVQFQQLCTDHLLLQHCPQDLGLEDQLLQRAFHLLLLPREAVPARRPQLLVLARRLRHPERRTTPHFFLRFHRGLHYLLLFFLRCSLLHRIIVVCLDQEQLQLSTQSFQVTPIPFLTPLQPRNYHLFHAPALQFPLCKLALMNIHTIMHGLLMLAGDSLQEQVVDLLGAQTVVGVSLVQGAGEFADQGEAAVQAGAGHGYGRWGFSVQQYQEWYDKIYHRGTRWGRSQRRIIAEYLIYYLVY